MEVNRFFTVALLALIATNASADLYKWVDENGQVHYSDTPGGPNGGKAAPKAKAVSIHDGFVIKSVTPHYPQRFSGKGNSRGVTLEDFHLRLPVSDGHRIKIGRLSRGDNCDVAGIYYWNNSDVLLDEKVMGEKVGTIFSQYGYLYSSSSAGSPLMLSTSITTMKVDSCKSSARSDMSRDAAYVKVSWVLRDTWNDKEIYKGVTEGSSDKRNYNPRKDGLIKTLDEAFSMATVNLLADKHFTAMLTSSSQSAPDVNMSATAPVIIHYGKRDGLFREQVQALETLAVTVKTKNGHGSGVLLDAHGHVLTNAHVVGENGYVTVSIGQRELRAQVLRKQPSRDVALVKIADESLIPNIDPLKTAKQEPLPGDEVYVIGTPLDLSLSATITKGIVSAKRIVDGQPFLQTDAAINPGNSGGPAFDANGELVAIAVAGIFTASGASVNINYLIPIDEAMKSLNIVALD